MSVYKLLIVHYYSLQFNAIFRNCSAGSYVVRWRVDLKKGFSIAGGLRFQVNVKYNVSLVFHRSQGASL